MVQGQFTVNLGPCVPAAQSESSKMLNSFFGRSTILFIFTLRFYFIKGSLLMLFFFRWHLFVKQQKRFRSPRSASSAIIILQFFQGMFLLVINLCGFFQSA